MKKAVNECSMKGYKDRREQFRWLANAGFEGLEFNINEPMSDVEMAEIKALSAEFGIEVVGFVTGQLWKHHLTSNDPAEREKGKNAVKMLIEHAKYFGCDSVLVVPGVVNENVSYLSAWRNCATALTELIPYIEQQKVNVCLENVWNKFLVSAFDLANFVDDLACPYICVYFDAGNVLLNAYPEYWVEILGDRIKRVHVKDFRRSAGNFDGFVGMGEGDLNWKALMKSLRDVKYDGFITLEASPYNLSTELYLHTMSNMFDIAFNL